MAYGLTPRQRDLLVFISEYMGSNQMVSPSMQEMADHMDIVSKSNIHRMLDALEVKGHLRRLRNRPRSIELLDGVATRANV